jgi:hypothetical protein
LSNHALEEYSVKPESQILERIVQDADLNQEKRKKLSFLGGAMHQFHHTELQQSETATQLIDNEAVLLRRRRYR